jgi:mRNA interferase MazF
MAGILRGDVVWADLNPVRGHEQAGRRPVVVLSEDVFNDRSGTVIAVAVTERFRELWEANFRQLDEVLRKLAG